MHERTGHWSNALLKYEKPSEENKGKVSTQNCVQDSVQSEASFRTQKWRRGVEST